MRALQIRTRVASPDISPRLKYCPSRADWAGVDRAAVKRAAQIFAARLWQVRQVQRCSFFVDPRGDLCLSGGNDFRRFQVQCTQSLMGFGKHILHRAGGGKSDLDTPLVVTRAAILSSLRRIVPTVALTSSLPSSTPVAINSRHNHIATLVPMHSRFGMITRAKWPPQN